MIHPMTTDELDEITKKAVLRINQANLGVTFTVGARQRMIAAGGGFPWFLHVLGQTTLLEALENRRSQIQSAHIESAINDLATHRLAQQLNDRYQLAVGESVQRETVLRLLARWRGTDVPVSEVYPLAQQLGVSNPAAHKATLLKEGYGRVLVQPPKLKGVVRFRDAMFKRFCFLRKSLFTGCDARVNEAWEQAHAIDKP